MDRKQFEEWFKTTDAYKLLEEMNYFKIDLFIFKEHRSQYQHTTVQIAYMTWQHQQAKVEELQKRVEAISEVLEELQEQVDVIRKRGQKFRDSNFLASADMMDICIKEIEQALKGEGQ
ncbi:hypothetical protein [Acinetobacter pittii]|uniref:hypothetical protein n=1 Tax=Acinetobacter pittii TaxID=48296 RepID=UPI00190028A9|nr:hypothetical protein [Acinetobacter pittii]MBJ8470339.1 hypothetical protein [Acinetobacter pittii]